MANPALEVELEGVEYSVDSERERERSDCLLRMWVSEC